MKSENGVVRHMVAVRFKADVCDADIASLMHQLADLRDHLPGIVDFAYRENISAEEPVVHGFRHLFWFDFSDETARDAYLADTKHQAIGAKLVTAADGGTTGIMVLDFHP